MPKKKRAIKKINGPFLAKNIINYINSQSISEFPILYWFGAG